MNGEEIRDVLYDAGMSKYQADAYVALLERGQASALEIADAGDVPQSRIYDVLRDLDSNGYVETFQQDTLKARIRSAEPLQTTLEERAERFQSVAEEIDERWEQPVIDDYVANIVKRFDTVQEHAEREILEAEVEVLAGLSPSQFVDLQPALREAYESGAVVNVVVNSTDGSSIPSGEELEGCVTELRYRDLSGPFHVHLDRSRLFFWPYEHSPTQYGVVVNDHSLSYIFYWYFQTCLWEQWRTVYTDRNDLPVRFTDFRRTASLLREFLEDDRRVEVTVHGTGVGAREDREITGDVVDVRHHPVTREAVTPDSVARYAGPTTIVVDDGDRTYSVGGWGAFEENIEMQLLTIERVDPPVDGFDGAT